jgi:preprotein translocase subunit SecA
MIPPLREASLALRYRASAGEPLDHLLVEAFSLAREAALRRVQMRHYPVQLLGGIAMHFGSIAVMATGEGKTLTATLPTYLAALSGNGAHVATANDYLASRDAQQMGPVFEALGLSVGVVQANASPTARHRAYRCDVTYTTAKEIGFDFLRDREALRRQARKPAVWLDVGTKKTHEVETVQREFSFIAGRNRQHLIDEARR